ncbi:MULTISPECIES: carbohydrate ABC transporter permease [Mycetocola]|uniref:carbohydrate ABC transporter permease n=1 Tax=Mycetocola TaxID=76634 RepID=UPI0004C1DC10|nr:MULTISPECIES: sugar ABC transporter permease [Mycetocola]
MSVSAPSRPAATRGGAGPSRRRRVSGSQNRTGWAFALPFVIVFSIFMMIPLVSSFLMSFTDITSRDTDNVFGVNVIGFEHYASLFNNPQFLRSMLNTAYFVVIGIPLTLGVGLALAVALNSGISRFRTAFRVGFYVPVVTSIVAVAVVWRFILQDDGLINSALALVGIDGPNWLHDPAWSMPAMILLAVWRNAGTVMIICLAGLQSVPSEVLEAGMVDGASAWTRFTRIVMPIMRPTLLLAAILLSVGYLQFFDEPFVMTQGGPLGSTLSVTYFTFNQFGFGNYGLASAASYVLFVAIALLSLIQFRVFRSKD